MACWATLIPPSPQSQTDFLIRLLIGCTAVPMAFSRLIGLGLITGGIIVIPVNQDQLCLMSHLGVLAQRKVGKGELTKNTQERKKEHKRKWHVRVPRWWTGAEKRLWGRCTTEGLWGGGETTPDWIWVDVRLSYHNWKLAACVESLKSIPMDTVTEAPGSNRSESGKVGREDERRKGISEWQGHSVQCGEGGEKGGGGQQQSGTDRHPHHLCFLLHKARPPCVRNLSFNLIPHTSASATKNKKTWRTSIFPKQQACQREHQHRERQEWSKAKTAEEWIWTAEC